MASLQHRLAQNVELRTKSGRQPLRTLQQELGSQPLDFSSFESCLRRFLPSADRMSLQALFEQNMSETGAVMPAPFARRVFKLEETPGSNVPATRPAQQVAPPIELPPEAAIPIPDEPVNLWVASRMPPTEDPGSFLHAAPLAMRRHAWEDAGTLPAFPLAPAADALPPSLNRCQFEAALEQTRAALDRGVASAGRQFGQVYGGLPPTERITLHASQAKVASRQLALLRRLRSVAPEATALSPEQLALALEPLRPQVYALLQGTCAHPPCHGAFSLLDSPRLLQAALDC